MAIPNVHRWFGVVDPKVQPRTCFVMMPFSAPWSNSVWKVIQSAISYHAISCVRADSMRGAVVLHDIVHGIARSSFLLADITEHNPNVFYEVGIAHAWEREVVTLAQEGTSIPFDTSWARHLFYTASPEGLCALGFKLRQLACELLEPPLTPSAIQIVSKAIPSAGSPFLGEYEGLWKGPQPGTLHHTLVVYDAVGSQVEVVYFWGIAPDWPVRIGEPERIEEAGHRRMYGRIENGALVLKWPDVIIHYRLTEDRGLYAERRDRGRIFCCAMKRVR